MSVFFPAACDAFLHREFTTAITAANGRYPITLAGWVRFGASQNKTLAAMGHNQVNAKHSIYSGSSTDIKGLYDANVGDTTTNTSTGFYFVDTWYFVAVTMTSLSQFDLFVSELNGTPTTDDDTTTSSGIWAAGNNIPYITFGSRDLDLDGGVGAAQNLYLADWAAWKIALNSTTLTALKNGALPSDYTTDQIGHWFVDSATTITESLADELGSEDLVQKEITDPSSGTPSVPVEWSSLHPAIGTSTSDPVLSNPLETTVTTTTIDATVETDTTSGTIYCMAYLAATSAPTHAQIKAGTGALGDGMESVTCDESPETLTQVTGLTQGTAYKLWITQELTGGEDSTPVSLNFTTVATTNKIVCNLIKVTDGTAYNNKTGVQYAVFSGTDAANLTEEYTGTAKVIDANGTIEIPTASHSSGNKLMVLIIHPTAGDMYADSTYTALGPMTVQTA